MPNNNQPRLGPKEDEELQRQIEANEGLFERFSLSRARSCRESSDRERRMIERRIREARFPAVKGLDISAPVSRNSFIRGQ